MPVRPHIIHRLVVEVEAPSEELAKRVRNTIPEILKNDVLPALEKYLDSLDPGEDIFRIDDLRIDIGAVPEEKLEYDFTGKVLESFRRVAGGIPDRAKEPADSFRVTYPVRFYPERSDLPPEELQVSKIAPSGEILEAFLYFLESGRLPWNISMESGILEEESIIEAVKENLSQAAGMIMALLKDEVVARSRLAAQFSGIFLERLLSFLMEGKAHAGLRAVYGQVEKVFSSSVLASDQIRLFYWRTAADNFFTGAEIQIHDFLDVLSDRLVSLAKSIEGSKDIFEKISALQKALELQAFPGRQGEIKVVSPFISSEIISLQDDQPGLSKAEKKLVKAFGDTEDGIFVRHAGLVLLHPFLLYFFKDLGILVEDRFKDRKAQQLAVHLLHYMATKEIYPAEYKLILEKFLCGFPVDEPVDRFVTITGKMKDECEGLLHAVIKNWGRLKGTSPDGLREAFIQREGKLITDSYQPRLIVEQKAQDVLLNYLPWGYSVIKLPWMAHPLFVEWND